MTATLLLAALETVVLSGVPHLQQRADFCGEACVAMWLGKLGKPADQDWVFEQTGLDPLEGRGAYSRDLARALKLIGFRAGAGWHSAGDEAGVEKIFRELHADLRAGVPSIVCMHSRDGDGATEHMRLVLGYDAATDEVVFHEPAERDGAYRRMKRALFLKLWPLKYEPASWTVIRFRLEAGPSLRAGRAAKRPGPADFAQHVMDLRRRMGGLSIALAPPFVVIGDAGRASVESWARGTVSWARDKLRAAYFDRDPDEILDVWLFKDAKSYRRHAKALFDDEPETPFGYYSPSNRALVMNIATGGGTLVHEIVHPYIRANFPEAPAWFNEGLGSLYEQSAERGGGIVGLTNWRLAGLQRAIRAGALLTFRKMIESSDAAFYSSEHGYAQARYLLYYLQEHGLLRKYYRSFHAGRREDRTGWRALRAVLGEEEMDGFQTRWEEFVLGLQFDG